MGYLILRYLPKGNRFGRYCAILEAMITAAIIVLALALVGHLAVMNAVDSFTGYGEQNSNIKF